jgi:hypothetical protein
MIVIKFFGEHIVNFYLLLYLIELYMYLLKNLNNFY